MIHLLINFILVMVLASCATRAPAKKKHHVLNTLQGMTESVIREFKRTFPEAVLPSKQFVFFEYYPSNMVADKDTGKLRPNHGVCKFDWSKPFGNKIYIYHKWWVEETNIWKKRKIMMHEFGHCMLLMKHAKNRSIMDTRLSTSKPDGSNWKALMKELKRRFDRGGKDVFFGG